MKKIFNYLLRVGISVALLWWLFTKKIDLPNTIEVIKNAHLPYITLAFLIFVLTNIIILIRWVIFIRALKLDVPLKEIIRYCLIGLFGNLFLPSAIGGDAIKIYGLCKSTPHKAKVVASILLDRLCGYIGLVIVVLFAFIIGHKHITDPTITYAILFVIPGTFVVMTVLFNERVYEFFCRVFNGVPKIKTALMQMHYDIALLKGNKKAGFAGLALSCLSHVLLAVLSFYIAKGLGQEVNLIYFLLFFPLISIAAALPSLGGLGVREAAAVYFFGKIGIESGIAASITLMTYIYMVIIGLIGGAVYVFTLSSGRIQHSASDTESGGDGN